LGGVVAAFDDEVAGGVVEHLGKESVGGGVVVEVGERSEGNDGGVEVVGFAMECQGSLRSFMPLKEEGMVDGRRRRRCLT
jgi:hypothetical protein